MNNSEVKFYHRNLPHYYVPGTCYFLTYRLAGSLPLSKAEELRNEYEQANIFAEDQNSDKNKIKDIQNKNWEKYFTKIDELLHNYKHSPRYLEDFRIAEIVVSSLRFFDQKEFDLLAYCIMSNHVHVAFRLKENSRTPGKIFGTIKGYSANQANKVLEKKGAFWQDESYDHVIRNNDELERIMFYIKIVLRNIY